MDSFQQPPIIFSGYGLDLKITDPDEYNSDIHNSIHTKLHNIQITIDEGPLSVLTDDYDGLRRTYIHEQPVINSNIE